MKNLAKASDREIYDMREMLTFMIGLSSKPFLKRTLKQVEKEAKKRVFPLSFDLGRSTPIQNVMSDKMEADLFLKGIKI